ncbi:uncharacterized protein BYT42DRAFT_562790 [Radiomyces spectabilis]|uniref:uncharacterized protein n=1 Tax=Radiomyces spectabilis TaxID=64574 RepID=UPI00221E9327|nr:uncharacterized protein BYT42DRAFT_562790 [Radiomyces spectabilis]KAI8384524.1 hypothetical protein BYT42DRAFT_562790 [Radiomyces spectabilis]
MQILDSVFIVTGGASGLGEQVVRTLVSHGGNVVILDLNAERAKKLVEELGSQVYCPGSVNVTCEESVTKAIETAMGVYKDIPLVGAVLCSGVIVPPTSLPGYGPNGMLTSYKQFESIMKVNVLGSYNVAEKVVPYMIKNQPFNDDGERGVIISVSSILGLDGVTVGYGTSKAAIAGLTFPLANELAPYGIRVMSIAPSAFATPLLDKLAVKAPVSPFPKRLGQPTEFADLVIHVIHNVMLNGSVIRLDGALRAVPFGEPLQ